MLGIPGGSKFTTGTLVTATDLTDATTQQCRVTVQATCEAAGPWGMVGTIEGIMGEQASMAVTKFLNYCSEKCAAATAGKSSQVNVRLPDTN